MAKHAGSPELESKISTLKEKITHAQDNKLVGIGVMNKELLRLMRSRPSHHVPQHAAFWK